MARKAGQGKVWSNHAGLERRKVRPYVYQPGDQRLDYCKMREIKRRLKELKKLEGDQTEINLLVEEYERQKSEVKQREAVRKH